MDRQDILDVAKASAVAVFNGGWLFHIPWGEVVSFLGGCFTVYVSLEKFYQVAQKTIHKLKGFREPPEG